jgi:hypothetical protein
VICKFKFCSWITFIYEWRLHIETVATKAYRTFIRLYSLLKSDRLSTKSKLTLHKALIMSLMTYACPAWKYAADTHLMKFQRLQNKVFRTIGKLPRNIPIRDMNIPSNSLRIRLHNQTVQTTSPSNSHL